MKTAKVLAIPGGLEPPTRRLEGGCSIQLSYGTLWFVMPNLYASCKGARHENRVGV